MMLDFRLESPEALTEKKLSRFLDDHRREQERLRRLKDIYITGGRVDKGQTAPGRANHVAKTNFAKYITDTATGYFAGIPPKYVFDLPEQGLRLQQVFDRNDETNVNYMLAEDMSICGVAYDMLWFDGRGDIRITPLDPESVFMIHDNTIEHGLLYAVRRYWAEDEAGNPVEKIQVYARDRVIYYARKGGVLRYEGEGPQYFEDIPITQYLNNRHGLGDFECVIENMEMYNLTLSNVSDDLHSTANAYLAISGMSGTRPEDIEEMNARRVALLEEGGDMHYVTKSLDCASSDSHKTTLRRDITQVACVPDLSDEAFSGTASGVALEYKMWGLDQLRAKKQQGMDKGLYRRLRLIAGALALKGENMGEIADYVTITYTRNMPKDTSVAVENAVSLSGIVSRDTVFKLVEPVTGVSVADELQKVSEYETAAQLQREKEQASLRKLNGAQMSALLSILERVQNGSLTREAGVTLAVATLGISEEAANQFFEENGELALEKGPKTTEQPISTAESGRLATE